MSDVDGVSAVAALDEPTRRRIYAFTVRHPSPVSRDDVADALDVPRNTAAFHLERLAAEGLLETLHVRRSGRRGPGAGRPAKLYRRAGREIAVSLPDRRYELAARLLADVLDQVQESGERPRAVLDRRARDLGREMGEEMGREMGEDARAAVDGEPDVRTAVTRALESLGFEPRAVEDTTVLVNCPFHRLARRHTEMVCGMNLCLLDGLLDGLAASEATARLEPAPDQCCVRLHWSTA